jgi:hypothetical protein
LGKIEVAICLLLFDSLVHQFLSTDALPIVPDTSAQIRGGQRDSFGFEGWGDLMAVHSSISCEVTSVSTSCAEDIVLGGGRGQQGGGAEISPPANRSSTRGNGTGGERTAGFHRFLRPNESELFDVGRFQRVFLMCHGFVTITSLSHIISLDGQKTVGLGQAQTQNTHKPKWPIT